MERLPVPQAMRVLWLALTQRLGAYDELAMATTRLRFMTSLEVTLGNVVPFAIHPFEVRHVTVM